MQPSTNLIFVYFLNKQTSTNGEDYWQNKSKSTNTISLFCLLAIFIVGLFSPVEFSPNFKYYDRFGRLLIIVFNCTNLVSLFFQVKSFIANEKSKKSINILILLFTIPLGIFMLFVAYESMIF